MKAKEGGDSRLVLPTFQPFERESSSIAVLSGLFCFKGAWLQSPGRRPGKTDATVWRAESQCYKKAEHLALGMCKIWQLVADAKKNRVKHGDTDKLLTSPNWLNMSMIWSVMLKMFLQSKFGMTVSLCSSGPLYRKLRMSSVVKLVSCRLLSMKCITVGFRSVSCSERNIRTVSVCKNM